MVTARSAGGKPTRARKARKGRNLSPPAREYSFRTRDEYENALGVIDARLDDIRAGVTRIDARIDALPLTISKAMASKGGKKPRKIKPKPWHDGARKAWLKVCKKRSTMSGRIKLLREKWPADRAPLPKGDETLRIFFKKLGQSS
jgi:hypothetical protein